MAQISKYGSKATISYEALHQALGLPEDVRIVATHDDGARDMISIKLHAEASKPGVAYSVGEGLEYPETSAIGVRRMVTYD